MPKAPKVRDVGQTAVDFRRGVVTVTAGASSEEFSLKSPEGFAAVGKAWLRAGWDAKYVYSFTWMGRPIIQQPEDMFRLQEILFTVRPDVLIETGVAHGGSLVFYATLFHAMGRGRVIGVDIEIRPKNRKEIETHPLSDKIELIEGDSIDPATIRAVKESLQPNDKVFVTLDSNHTRDHVLQELEALSPLVSPGSYIVVMDGIMEDLPEAPRTQPDWEWNNPRAAATDFVDNNPDFVVEEPEFLFNEGMVQERVTYWPCGFLKRIQ